LGAIVRDDGKPGGGGAGGSGGPGGATAADPKAGEVVPGVLVRRLSQSEIDNTLEDVLGDTTRPAHKFLLEDELRPYDNDYTLQKASRAFTDAVREMARDVARRAVSTPQARAAFMRCQPQGPGDAACFRQTIQALGRRLLRRPLAAREVDAYATLQRFATETNAVVKPDFFTAVELVLRALVQDPEFLHRVEGGRETKTPGVFALGGFEIASRMSYLLWGSAPDEALLDAAERDRLIDPDGRAAELGRMLKAKRARTQLHRFHALWLGYRAIPHPPALTALFNEETTALIDSVVFDEPRSYAEVFTSPRTFVSAPLAAHYGLPAPPGGKGWVTYDGRGRAGILSHGAVLAAFSKFSDTSPTQRGIFVQTRLLCNEIADPPANVDVDQPPGNPDQDCKTDRYLAHMDQSGCRGCHALIDPIGLGLENYDVAGRWRDADDGKPRCRIPGQGELPGGRRFSGPKELAAALVGANEIQACVVRQYLTFALGRELARAEEPLAGALARGMSDDGHRLESLLRRIVLAPSFALRRTEEAP
jgi:hypothetical protein